MREAVASKSIYFGMDTEITHYAFGKYSEEALSAVCEEAKQLEMKLSRFIPTSEISGINRSSGIQCENISADTYELLSLATSFSKCCQGLFDVTIGPLVNLWDYKNTIHIPNIDRIKSVLSLVNYNDLILNQKKKTAMLQKEGQSIDCGGIGKGFASDKFIEVFNKFGVSSAFTNIGGNVATLGTKPDGSLWRVGIRHPRLENSLVGAILVADKAVVTSGDYQRYFIDSKGKRYHHIMNPLTGYPCESGLISVTIVTDRGVVADALSTILLIAGMKKGWEILSNYPGTEAILIDTNLHIYITKGLKEQFQSNNGIKVNILDY